MSPEDQLRSIDESIEDLKTRRAFLLESLKSEHDDMVVEGFENRSNVISITPRKNSITVEGYTGNRHVWR